MGAMAPARRGKTGMSDFFKVRITARPKGYCKQRLKAFVEINGTKYRIPKADAICGRELSHAGAHVDESPEYGNIEWTQTMDGHILFDVEAP